MDSVIERGPRLASLTYNHCATRIVDLQALNLPETASDEEYRRIYDSYVHSEHPSANAVMLRDAVQSISHGLAPPVAFPTETVYGLGASGLSEASVSAIFAAKNRPADNPLILHASSIEHLESLLGPLPPSYQSVAQRFWPGPLTILLPVPENSPFATNVHPGQRTIGFRIPSSKYARFFIAATGQPIAGPSANSSGKPSPTNARHVFDDMQGKINFILDGGECDVGVESTVVDGLHDPPLILRPGGISLAELRRHGEKENSVWAKTAVAYQRHGTESSSCASPGASSSSESLVPSYVEDISGAPRAPGMKYRHYAPKGRLVLFSEQAFANGKVHAKFEELVEEHIMAGTLGHLKIGMISTYWPIYSDLPFSPSQSDIPAVVTESPFANRTTIAIYSDVTGVEVEMFHVQIGPSIEDLAHSLFGVLRYFDDLGCDYIFAETVRQNDNGGVSTGQRDVEDAVEDRLGKAASERIDE